MWCQASGLLMAGYALQRITTTDTFAAIQPATQVLRPIDSGGAIIAIQAENLITLMRNTT